MTRVVSRWATLVLLVGITAVLLLGGWHFWVVPTTLASTTQSPTFGGVVPLVTGTQYAAWYEQATGYKPDSDYFGSYVMVPQGDRVYFGFGTARPAEENGALLAAFDTHTMTAVTTLNEQGFIDMTWFEDALYIPGADPCCPDDWQWGNMYVYTPTGSTMKHRNLPNVVHAWGVWADEAQVVVAASMQLGASGQRSGGVFSTTNASLGWTQVATAVHGVGDYRTYDVIQFVDKLHVVWSDAYDQGCGLAIHGDDGIWTRLAVVDGLLACRTRLLIYDDELVTLAADRASLFLIDETGKVREQLLPDFLVQEWAYHYGVVDEEGFLYLLAEDGRIKRSDDLVTWETVVAGDKVWTTVAHWPHYNWLLMADRGSDMGLWRLDLGAAVALAVPELPEPTMSVQPVGLLINWPDVLVDEAGKPVVVAGYRIYEHTAPYFDAVAPAYLDTTVVGSHDLRPFTPIPRFYRLRSVGEDDVLSASSQTVGAFPFALEVDQ